MSRHTSFRIGGKADVLALPQSISEIEDVLRTARETNTSCTIVGNGSNLLVRDGGIRGIVLKLSENFSKHDIVGGTVYAQSGTKLMTLSSESINKNLAGLQFAGGIPGSLGGAVYMNAGAYGGQIADVFVKANCLDSGLNRVEISADEADFGYRESIFKNEKLLLLECWLKLSSDESGSAKAEYIENNRLRKDKQPVNYPSAGSVFKRPEGHFAGKLIQDAGLKGRRIGGASVSTLHSGFIINEGNATAKDVLTLIDLIREEVKKDSSVVLEHEIVIIGED